MHRSRLKTMFRAIGISPWLPAATEYRVHFIASRIHHLITAPVDSTAITLATARSSGPLLVLMAGVVSVLCVLATNAAVC
ncbi:hypothetical protein SETIT_1G341900v2 [Setaria italica]|uniref:Uncharacterized protein n=1 Tax=Setaria italica TaxID=4555 RepID=A0A368PSM2_SETIT|nr:hypothetical protein SETIT_1G341900v2 [Setaria italica]